MRTSRLAAQRAEAPHICTACTLPFVCPEFGVPVGGRWRVLLRCLSCGWCGEKVFEEEELEKFERELDDERDQLELDLERLTQHNMRQYYACFVAALGADAILPEDF